jgi:hypothetical protein
MPIGLRIMTGVRHCASAIKTSRSFAKYNCSYCDESLCYDFPNEPFYQVRAITAAIGLWRVGIYDKPDLIWGRTVTSFRVERVETSTRARRYRYSRPICSLFIRDCSVVLFKPSRAAAPFGPPTAPFASFNARRILSRS